MLRYMKSFSELVPKREINGPNEPPRKRNQWFRVKRNPGTNEYGLLLFLFWADNFTGTIKYHSARHSNTELLKIYKYNITW